MFETILFPVDFSKRCAIAAKSVAAYARTFNSQVTLLHVVEMPDFLFGMPEYNVVSFAQIRDEQLADRKAKMEDWAATEMAGLSVRRLVVQGDPAREIVGKADECKSSLIMMPSHGVGPFRRFMIGSTTAKVLHDSHVPVWTDVHTEEVPGEDGEENGHELQAEGLKSLICGIDLGPHSEDTLKMAAALARRTNGDVTIAHAIPAIEVRPVNYLDTEFSAQLSAEARGAIADIQKRAGTSFRVCIHGGEPSEVVREAALAHKAGLVVIARGAILGGLGRLRTHAYSIINKSPVPVLSV
jgi:nucleotide-binding universal stress UspA family protein